MSGREHHKRLRKVLGVRSRGGTSGRGRHKRLRKVLANPRVVRSELGSGRETGVGAPEGGVVQEPSGDGSGGSLQFGPGRRLWSGPVTHRPFSGSPDEVVCLGEDEVPVAVVWCEGSECLGASSLLRVLTCSSTVPGVTSLSLLLLVSPSHWSGPRVWGLVPKTGGDGEGGVGPRGSLRDVPGWEGLSLVRPSFTNCPVNPVSTQ